jgi:hypothetical protein
LASLTGNSSEQARFEAVALASGLPFNYVTGVNNSGDAGATTDRPVVNGSVISRNAGRGAPIYDVSPLVERPITFNEHFRIEPRIEVCNVFNHANLVGYSGTYGNGAGSGPGFGAPRVGVTNQLPARFIQFQNESSFLAALLLLLGQDGCAAAYSTLSTGHIDDTYYPNDSAKITK